ncbi:MAG: DUF1566 domain-containing protein [Alphaproteobacteria bacterium]|nr:DUF1566 domain-containing protein [Alphaproteobacteria bacterium]
MVKASETQERLSSGLNGILPGGIPDELRGFGDVVLVPGFTGQRADGICSSVDKRAYRIGAVLTSSLLGSLHNRWIVGPKSPITGSVMAIEVPPKFGLFRDDRNTWNEWQDHVKALRAQGHENARIPDAYELYNIWHAIARRDINPSDRNKHARFNVTKGAFYWSSTVNPLDRNQIKVLDFSDGEWYWGDRDYGNFLPIFVRDEPDIKLIHSLN